MSAVDEILSQIPMTQLAGRLGVDAGTAEQAVRQTLPALLGGIQANTEDPGGAASFARAVSGHDPALVDGGVDLDQVDETDGYKIVGHVFGERRDDVVRALGAPGADAEGLDAPAAAPGLPGGAVTKDLIGKLLPILAPIVMAWLAKKLGGGTADPGAVPAGSGGPGGLGGVLGDLLGGVLGGSGGSGGSGGGSAGGPDLGSILGDLLGGGRR
ncbi:MAG: DUF937 domain-containing protein [Pseudonocardia sp.]